MSNKKYITVLCNNRMAMPAIQTLHSQGLLRSIGVPEDNAELLEICKAFTAQAGIILIALNKTTLVSQLNACLAGEKEGYVFTMTFPWKIPKDILEKYPLVFYNFHYGLLPHMRGADPVFEAVRQQCKETGITVHQIENKIDKGAVLLAKVLPLNLHVTHGMLCTQLSYLGAQLLPEVIALLQAGTTSRPQDEAKARYYRRPVAADVCINWEKQDAKTIEALARACNPWNKGAYTQWNGWNIRIVEATALDEGTDGKYMPGSVISNNEAVGLTVQCSNRTTIRLNFIYTDEGFMSGHRLAAFGIKEGDRFISILN